MTATKTKPDDYELFASLAEQSKNIFNLKRGEGVGIGNTVAKLLAGGDAISAALEYPTLQTLEIADRALDSAMETVANRQLESEANKAGVRCNPFHKQRDSRNQNAVPLTADKLREAIAQKVAGAEGGAREFRERKEFEATYDEAFAKFSATRSDLMGRLDIEPLRASELAKETLEPELLEALERNRMPGQGEAMPRPGVPA